MMESSSVLLHGHHTQSPAGLQHPAAPPPSSTFFGNPSTPGPVFTPPSSYANQSPGPEDASTGESSKRRRIARACDLCRKKKIKCDGKAPACTHCVNCKAECVFTVVEKKRNPPKGAKYIEGLENRLNRMETLLRLSGVLNEGDDQTDLGDLERRLQRSSATSSQRAPSQPARSSSESARETPATSAMDESSKNSNKDDQEVTALSDQMCSLVTDNCGEARFIGSSSGFSIFSPRGIQWVNEKTGDDTFQRMIIMASNSQRSKNRQINGWKDVLFGKLFGKQGRDPPPPKDMARGLVNDYFMGFNMLFPLFHQPTFEALFEKQYSDSPPIESGWYAAFNIVLAIACRLRMSNDCSPSNIVLTTTSGERPDNPIREHVEKSWDFFQNAASVMLELLMKNSDLLSIQAIIGMAFFLQGTSNPQPSFFLISAAVRVALGIGIHRRGNTFGLSESEVEQRRRIFWIIYLIDKDAALRSGRPPCINDDDCNVELPDEHPIDGCGLLPFKNGTFNLFRAMARFSEIQSKVYMQLYSAKASKQTDGELLQAIGRLDKELEEWRMLVPAELRPDDDVSGMAQSLQGGTLVHLLVLHFAYYNCLTTIHRMSIHHGYWSNRLSDYAIAGLSVHPLNPRVFSSASLCVSAARATVRLMEHLDPKDYSCIWLVMYYPVAALVTLFANVIQNPHDPRGRSDLQLISNIVDFLSSAVNLEHVDEARMTSDDVQRMILICREFRRIAESVLEKAEKEGSARRKRKLNGEFIPKPTASNTTKPPSAAAAAAASASPATHTPTEPSSRQSESINPDLHPNNMVSQQIFTGNLENPFSPATSMSWGGDLDHTMSTPTMDHTPILSPDATGLFDQPFVPQDLWQMPMNLEWDWPDASTLGWEPSMSL